MTKFKVILTAASLLLASAVLAAPSIELRGTGAKAGGTGDVAVILHPGGTPIVAITVQFSATALGGASMDVASANVVPSSSDWGDFVALSTGNPDDLGFGLLWERTDGPALTDQVVCTIKMKQNAAGIVTSTVHAVPYDPGTGTGSYVNDDQYNSISVEATTTFVGGAGGRYLGGAAADAGVQGAASKSVVAAIANGKLSLLKVADLTDAAPAVALGGAKGGRPGFGAIGADLVVAAGDEAGNVKVVKVADGTTMASLTGAGAVAGAPIIFGGDLYVAGAAGGNVTITHKGAATDTAAAGAGTVLGTPAISPDGARLVIGTSGGVQTFARDANGALTPMVSVAGDFATSPAIIPPAAALVADAAGNVAKVDLTTGNAIGSPLALGTAVSSGFRENASGTTFFGGADGNIYKVSDANAKTGTVAFGSAAVCSPVVIAGKVYAGDASGKFGQAGGSLLTLSGPVSAVVATGATAGTDVVLGVTAAGGVVAIPQ